MRTGAGRVQRSWGSYFGGERPPADQRGLTPLFWAHVLPYGEVNLDMTTLSLRAAAGETR